MDVCEEPIDTRQSRAPRYIDVPAIQSDFYQRFIKRIDGENHADSNMTKITFFCQFTQNINEACLMEQSSRFYELLH